MSAIKSVRTPLVASLILTLFSLVYFQVSQQEKLKPLILDNDEEHEAFHNHKNRNLRKFERVPTEHKEAPTTRPKPSIPKPPRNENVILGFVRNQKAASTSLLAFLNYESGLSSWSNAFDDEKAKEYITKYENSRHVDTPFCVFGHLNSTQENSNNPFGLDTSRPKHRQKFCPYVTANRLQQYHKDSLEYVSERNATRLQLVTMIRDPLERLYSLYQSAREKCSDDGSGSGIFTDDQKKRVCRGDFAGLTRDLYREGGARVRDVPNQHLEFQDKSANDAIDSILTAESKNGGILVLLSDCFEESLWLLEHLYGLTPGSAKSFIEESEYSHEYKNPNGTIKQAFRRAKLESTQKDLEYWFADEYKFYNAAVEQFQYHLASIDLDPSLVTKSCRYWTQQDKARTQQLLFATQPQRRCLACDKR